MERSVGGCAVMWPLRVKKRIPGSRLAARAVGRRGHIKIGKRKRKRAKSIKNEREETYYRSHPHRYMIRWPFN